MADAKTVMELREKTGAGVMDCKAALQASNGNLDAAVEYLRKKGLADAKKREHRDAKDGLVHAYIHPGSKLGVLIEVDCETDFVAKTDAFQELVRDLAMQVAATNPSYVAREDVPATVLEKEREIYRGQMADQIFSVFLGEVPRDDAIPYVADFFLQLENIRWTLVSGIVHGSFVMSVRNLGYTKNAGDFVRRFFVDIGSAGGHRAMAKAVIPIEAFRSRFGPIDESIGARMSAILQEFLHEAPEKRKEPVGSAQ